MPGLKKSQIMIPKNSWSSNFSLVLKNFLFKKIFGWKTCYSNFFKNEIVVTKIKFGIKWQMSLGQMLPGQMSLWHLASVKDGPRNLLLKFYHNQVRNSWYNPDMDKCHMDKCWLDKCHFDIWKLLNTVPGTSV